MTSDPFKIFIGWDPREQAAYEVCRYTLLKHSSIELDIQPLVQKDLRELGFYTRPENEPASTQFTYTRFLVPELCQFDGWALFVDCDFLYNKDIAELLNQRREEFAVMCVKHDYIPNSTVKMDGQKQVVYPRKNWSSMVLWNCSHKSNRSLTAELVNSATPAFLHRFKWVKDKEIGEVSKEWNWLVGEYSTASPPPAALHFTLGGPWLTDYDAGDYTELWQSAYEEAKGQITSN